MKKNNICLKINKSDIAQYKKTLFEAKLQTIFCIFENLIVATNLFIKITNIFYLLKLFNTFVHTIYSTNILKIFLSTIGYNSLFYSLVMWLTSYIIGALIVFYFFESVNYQVSKQSKFGNINYS